MSRKFLNFLLACLGFSKKERIPKEIGRNEKICRIIYSPMNFRDKKCTRIDPNIFKSPKDKDEVSVNRLDYTTPEFCKNIARKQQKPEDKRSYYGFAILYQSELLTLNFDTVYSPIKKPKSKRNLFHADIKSGFVVKKGEPVPTSLTKMIDDLVKKARYYPDPDITSIDWTGGQLI